jgi:hypothetical protein
MPPTNLKSHGRQAYIQENWKRVRQRWIQHVHTSVFNDAWFTAGHGLNANTALTTYTATIPDTKNVK